MPKDIIIFSILILVVLSGIFYFQTTYAPVEMPFQETRQDPPINQTSENEVVLPMPETSETAPSTPYTPAKGEISRGNPNKKQIIFTFDGGAGIHSAQKILDTTKKHGVKTTFFITGKFAEQNPDLIRQMASEGHEIFNHTYSHPRLTQISDEEIQEEFAKTEQIIKDLTGKTTRPYFRPPYGDRNQHVWDFAAGLGYQSVFWTTDALDWMPDKTTEQVKQRIYSNLKPGAIILMHNGDDITGNILDEVFTHIKEQGYKIVSLTEGLQ